MLQARAHLYALEQVALGGVAEAQHVVRLHIARVQPRRRLHNREPTGLSALNHDLHRDRGDLTDRQLDRAESGVARCVQRRSTACTLRRTSNSGVARQ